MIIKTSLEMMLVHKVCFDKEKDYVKFILNLEKPVFTSSVSWEQF
jgi:hypothetical protein